MPSRYRSLVRWGQHKENEIWLASTERWRFMWKGHDSLYLSMGYLRMRIMKPWIEDDTPPVVGTAPESRESWVRRVYGQHTTDCPTRGVHVDGEDGPWYDHDHHVCLQRWPDRYESM